MKFKPHDRVIIGGRTMLRPGYSLVGMTGTVFATGEFAPAGQVQVIVDGETIDDEGSSRALVINVPSIHLEPVKGPESLRAMPLPAAMPESEPESEKPIELENPGEPKTPPPGLRLV